MASRLEAADIVIITVNEHEQNAVDAALTEVAGRKPDPSYGSSRDPYDDFGIINGQHVVHARSMMGSTSSGASRETTINALTDLKPKLLLAVGVAWGAREADGQAIGDVLISRQVQIGVPVKVTETDMIPRGPRPELTATAIKQLNATKNFFLKEVKIHQGTLLSQETLFDSYDARKQVLIAHPELIGGEMEGAGIYQGIRDSKAAVEWLIVKGICDWGYKKNVSPKEKSENQAIAATWAARLCATAIKHYPLVEPIHGPALPDTQAGRSPAPVAPDRVLKNILLDTDPTTFLKALSSPEVSIEVFGNRDLADGAMVYWPVRIRRPNVVHAVQTFIAAGLEERGFDVRLCFDDLGSTDGYDSIQSGVEHLGAAIHRWATRATNSNIADQIRQKTRQFSEFVGDSKTRKPKAGALEALGNNLVKWLLSEDQLRAVLKQSKLLKPDVDQADLDRKPRKLLSPAVAWTVLELLSKELPACSCAITLGGEDERPIWMALPEIAGLHVTNVLLPRVKGDMDSDALRPTSRRAIQTALEADPNTRDWFIRYAWHLPELMRDELTSALEEKQATASATASERIEELAL